MILRQLEKEEERTNDAKTAIPMVTLSTKRKERLRQSQRRGGEKRVRKRAQERERMLMGDEETEG